MIKVLVILGPTAVGKTSLSIELAKNLNGEIINGDSVQVYKRLDIGSAKIKLDEMQGIKHHLLDIKDPSEPFSVAEFQKLVREKINEIHESGKLPIIAGGTGLYIQAALYDYQFEDLGRDELFSKKYENLSNEDLHLILNQVDSKEAEKIHPNNRRRVLRALEIYENQKKTKSGMIDAQKHLPLYDILIIGLDMERKLLYERINKRVNNMISENLLDEVKGLYDEGIKVNAIGYKEFYDYFNGQITLEEAVENVKKNTRNYAKRQLTYFRNKLPVKWYEVKPDNTEAIYKEIYDNVNEWINQKG